jgi:nickel/cobalt transporter (NicO) family protein
VMAMARLVAAAAVAAAALLVLAAPASAHPLGNFTTNRYARVEVGADVVRVRYVLDEAELVAFRARAELARDRDAVAAARIAEIAQGLRLEIDGRATPLLPIAHRLSEPEGQGGLSTLRLDVVFEAQLGDGGSADATFADGNQPDRIGWREIVVSGMSGARIIDSTVPAEDRSDGLRSYPEDLTDAPLDVRAATFSFAPGAGEDRPASLDDVAATARGGDRFVALVGATTTSPPVIAGAMLAALVLGGVHALGPGHGKTLMAAYLVTTQGRRRDALALGGIVSLMHTASVLALALFLATIGKDLAVERVYPVLTVVAGALVTGVGGNLLRRRLAARSRAADARTHVHAQGEADGHDHPHDHGHPHGPDTHTHEVPDGVRPLSRAGLVALGTSGGLFPSPSAVVVLVGAFALGRAGLGLALIAAFSVGLAAVLVGVGLVLVAGRDRLDASGATLRLAWLPIAGAVAMTVLGVVLVVQGVLQLR